MGTEVSSLTFQTDAEFVAAMTAAYGGSLGILPLLKPGDPALAIFQAVATQDDFLQFLMQIIWAAARLSTSSGSDVDSFVNDFGLTRLPATYATGPVTLTALTAPSFAVPVAPGAIVQTPGGAIQYQIIADTTQSAWNAAQNVYLLPAGQNVITVTVQATVAGSVDNVQAAQLSQFGSALPGIDLVTNGAAITNGLDQETDTALKARFVQFLASLSKATVGAYLFAANSVQQGLDLLPLENTNVSLVAQNGINTMIVDDGTGSPSSTLLNSVLTALNNVRAFGIQVADIGPTVIATTITLTIIRVLNPTETQSVTQSTVQTAIVNYVNAIQLSANSQYLYLNNIVEVAKDADPNVLAIANGSVLINGVAADLLIGTGGLPRTTLASVTVNA